VLDDVFCLGIGDPFNESSEEEFLDLDFSELNHLFLDKPHLLKPLVPPEIWGCGLTYIRSIDARETKTAAQGICD